MKGQTPDWSSRIFVGETPLFETAHLQVEAELPGSRAKWPELIRDSVGVARQLSGLVPAAKPLQIAAYLVGLSQPNANPWLVWVQALARVTGIPDWPCKVEEGENGRFRIRLGYPYPEAAQASARFALDLLRISAGFRDRGRLRVNSRVWEKHLADLTTGLPPRPVMQLHRALHDERILWGWTRHRRTVVGSGSRRRVIRDASAQPELQAAAVAHAAPQIPLFTVTGSVGKTTTVRLLSQLLEGSGHRQGLAASDGAWADGRRIGEGDCIDGLWAARLLARSDVDVALLEVGCGGIIGYGIPYPQSDVAILLNIGSNHVGQRGTETIEEMTEVKALSVARGRLRILNHADPCCREIGATVEGATCVWFSPTLAPSELRDLSRDYAGVLGISRDLQGAPKEITVWRGGRKRQAFSLEGVAPYQGMLGEKTLEQLLAAVAAVAFGPVHVEEVESGLRKLCLDAENHPFRTSVHVRGNCVFVLDKGSESALELLAPTLSALRAQHQIERSIVAFTLGPAHIENTHRATCALFHALFDELLSFERPDAYQSRSALSDYGPGDVSRLHQRAVRELNKHSEMPKPFAMATDWDEAENWLRKRIMNVCVPTLILINQPTTGDVELNRRILGFVGSMH